MGLGVHFVGSLGNLILLWLFTTNKWSGSSQQFACVGTVVPIMMDGIMFVIFLSIYCKFMFPYYSSSKKLFERN